MKSKLQEALDTQGMGHIKAVDIDTVIAIVDGEDTIFYRTDQYAGHPLSGYATFGAVGGDHRMIKGIADDIGYVFDILKKLN